MGLSEIETRLPNGFHDMRLTALHLNLCDQIAVLEVDVLVGLPGQDVERRDEYRSALLEFTGVKAFAVDPPDPTSAFRFPGAADVVITDDEKGAFSKKLISVLPAGLNFYTIYVRDWLTNIRIAANGIELKWGRKHEKR